MLLRGVIVFLVITFTNGQMEVQEIKQNGIMFESLGQTFVYQQTWTIITRLTLLDPEEAIDFIKRCETAVKSTCSSSSTKIQLDGCAHWLEEISLLASRIKSQIEEIKVYLGTAKRKKREILNAVGRLSKFLFGTMDDQDAESIYDRLNKLEKHDETNLHLMQKQMTVLKSTFDTTSSQIHNLSVHQNYLDRKFNNLSTKMHTEMIRMSHDMRLLHIKSEINQVLLFMLTKLQLMYSHISDQFTLINSLHQHKLHPLLISSSLLKRVALELTNNTKKYLPLDDFHLLNQITEVTSYHDEKGLVVKIKLPLILANQHILYKVHLIPMHIGSYTSILDIESNFILVNSEKQYVEFAERDWKNMCKKCISTDHHFVTICKQNQPKVIDNYKSTCLVSLFFEKEIGPRLCKYKYVQQTVDVLSKLEQKDTWLFVFEKVHKILAHCDQATQIKTLSGSGILKLTQQCTYTIDTLELPYEGNHEIELPLKQPKEEINFKIKEFPFKFAPVTGTPFSENTIPPYQNNHAKLQSQGKTIEEMEQELSQEEHQRKIERHQNQSHINSGGITLLALVLILFILFKLRKTFFTRKLSLNKDLQPTHSINMVTEKPKHTDISLCNPTDEKTYQSKHDAIQINSSQDESKEEMPTKISRSEKLRKSFKMHF